MNMKSIYYSHNQSPSTTPNSNASPQHKTQLILKAPKMGQFKEKLSIDVNATKVQPKPKLQAKVIKHNTNADIDLQRQLTHQMELYRELQQKYELSRQEISKYQNMLDRVTQKKQIEKEQQQHEINQLKKQIEHRSKSQLDMQETGILSTIVSDYNCRALLKELQQARDKNKNYQEEVETKNLQLDYLTKKLINYQNCQDLVAQIQQLTLSLQEKDQKVKEYEEQLSKLKYNHPKFLMRSLEYLNKTPKSIEHLNTTIIHSTMSNPQDTNLSEHQAYINL